MACAIELENTVVVTGGGYTIDSYTRVQVYSTEGPLYQLPRLGTGRMSHGCGYYVDSGNRVVSIVHSTSYIFIYSFIYILYLV